MNEISNDYKNGFNECCELILKKIDEKIHCSFNSNESIYSSLLDLKFDLLEQAFKTKK